MMFFPNSERQINLSSGDYRTPTSIISSLGFNPNYNPMVTTSPSGVNPSNLNDVTNMMDNYNNFWSHTVPTNMPWAQPQIQPTPTNLNTIEGQPYIMRFTAGPSIYNDICSPDPCTSQTATEWELLNKLSSGTGTCTSNLHLKRRNSSDDDDFDEAIGQPPTKQYISEDKVTAKFNEMSLNNVEPVVDHPISPSTTTNRDLEDDELESEEDISNDATTKSTIVLSDEIKQALNARNDRIEKLFQDELNRSTKSVVLWQPPIGILQPPLNVYKNEKKEEKEKPNEIIVSSKSYELLDFDVDENCLMDANEMMDL